MKIRSIRREIRLLRIYALASTAFAALALLGAAEAVHEATLDTLTVHRINVMDREGKLAMVLTSHDDVPAPVQYGYTGKRSEGANADNGIILYNQLGDEQGALIWSAARDRSDSGNVLSFDTAQTDQLIQVRNGDEKGRHYAGIVGWDRAANESATVSR